MVDDRAKARKARRHHRLVVLQDQLDGVLLELSQKRLARVFQQRHHYLQRTGHGADDLQNYTHHNVSTFFLTSSALNWILFTRLSISFEKENPYRKAKSLAIDKILA